MKEGGLTDDMIRLSVGLEDINDIKKDFERGFKAVKSLISRNIMIINFKGAKTYIGTGGKSLDITKMTLCFLHGAGQNHLSFIQQARFLLIKGIL